jgi:hypothetical protein
MANTYYKIASVEIGAGGASSIDFTSIPSTYTDLCLKVSGRSTASYTRRVLQLTFNGSSSSSDYQDRYLYGSGSAAASGADASGTQPYILIWDLDAANATANTFGSIDIYIPNYASTSAYKSISADGASEDNATTIYMGMVAGLYQQNTAITSLSLKTDSGNFVQYSTAYLYGIKNS